MKNLYPLLTSLIFLILLLNCEDLLIDEVTEEDRLDAQKLVDEADSQLFADLRDISDKAEQSFDEGGLDSIGTTVQNSLDVSDSYNNYKKALELDPENTGANFGSGYMEVAMASQDELLEQTLNDWVECFSDLGIWEDEPEQMPRSSININEFKLGLPQSGKAFFAFDMIRILNYVPIVTSHEYVLQRNTYDRPEIESLQILLEEVFLTRISTAISRLDKVVGRDFVFTITQEMWETLLGDNEQERLDLDDTEIYLMKAFLHQVRAMIYAAVTYNVNVPYYDFIEADGWLATNYDWQWLAQNSEVLTIRSGKEQSLANAQTDLNNVLNSVESAWTFLKADTDIDYDLILLDDIKDVEEDMEEEIDRDVEDFLDEARQVLNEDYPAKLGTSILCESYQDSSGYYQDCDTTKLDVTLNIKNFLTSPPQNLKEIIPRYSLETDVCEAEDEWNNETDSYEIVEWGCPKLTWNVTTCDQWKNGWDVTLGGLFPYMTTEKFFGEDMFELDPEDCEEILSGGELDF